MNAEVFKDLIKKATNDSLAHGFKGREKSSFEFLTQAACEVAEAVDAYKHCRKADVNGYDRAMIAIDFIGGSDAQRRARKKDTYERFIKDSIQDEMADVMIYLMVMAGHYIKLEEFEQWIFDSFDLPNRYEMEQIEKRCNFLQRAGDRMRDILELNTKASNIVKMWFYLELWMKLEGLGDLEKFVRLKMDYNRQRPYLHGIKGDPTA